MDRINDPVASLAESLSGLTDKAGRERAFMTHAAGFGVSCFVYAHLTPLEQLRHLESNYPSTWINRYIAQNHHLVDPVYRHALVSPTPFTWRQALELPQYADLPKDVFVEAAQFGLIDGYCIPIRGPDSLCMMSMAVTDASLFAADAPHRLHALHLMALYFHMACERAMAAAVAQAIHLTEREREVLCWAAQGKTGWEIAQILNLAERTVTFHIENAKTKLGANSRGHAAVKALSLGLISF